MRKTVLSTLPIFTMVASLVLGTIGSYAAVQAGANVNARSGGGPGMSYVAEAPTTAAETDAASSVNTLSKDDTLTVSSVSERDTVVTSAAVGDTYSSVDSDAATTSDADTIVSRIMPAEADTSKSARGSFTPVTTPKTDPSSWFGAGRLTMLANHDSAAQNLSVLIETGDGGLIVVDGGWEDNADSLIKEIKARGGHVSAWLITHPHRDHAMALACILKDHAAEIQIDGIYYSFFENAWYEKNDPESEVVLNALNEGFSHISADRLHGDIRAGQVIPVGQALIQVLNEPYEQSTNCGNNSSVVYMVSLNGTNVVFLGDLGLAGGNSLMNDIDLASLRCDMVQLAHHGQSAVSFTFYQRLGARVFLWPTPQWLWDNDNGGGAGSGRWTTAETRKWQTGLLVREYYATKDGDQIIE